MRDKMRLNAHINRMPIFGVGCGGGVSGMAKANTLAKANPDAVVLLVAVELCSLTLIKSDYSKSNFIGSSLFSDGISACIVKRDNNRNNKGIKYVASSSKLYYDSLYVLEKFMREGFEDGYGLMLAMGPGFSSEMVLLEAKGEGRKVKGER